MIVQATSYCQSGVTASGQHTRPGIAASNNWPLGTRLTIKPRFYGRSRFTVLDRVGWGSDLDLFTPSCTAALTWGRRPVRITMGWARRHRSYRAVLVHKRMVF